MPDTDVLSLEVPCSKHAPAAVRRSLAAAHTGEWSLDDGLLVASELVTNAVQHSGCHQDDRLRIEVTRRDGNLVISVTDPGLSGGQAEPGRPTRMSPGGRGLQIIQRLSVRWGSRRDAGYRVWAELAPTPPV